MNIPSTIKFAFLTICICLTYSLTGQSISVIHISGDSFIEEENEERTTYKKIVFGPLPDTDKILVKEDASLKLLNNSDEICELSKAGTYNIDELDFQKPKSSNVFAKFCDYFHSFFINHSSAESKANYKNSIYAISRGKSSPPRLDFPFEGAVPNDAGPLLFSWSHACDSCQYVVSIHDLATKVNVYAWTTIEKSVELPNPPNFLIEGEEYYWTVNISGEDIAYDVNIFSISEKGSYKRHVEKAETEVIAAGFGGTETGTIYVMSDLAEKDMINYSIIYGNKKVSENQKNELLSNFVDRFWYDRLIE